MRIYFSGLGGVGIGPLVQIAYDAGFEVLGSDAAKSPITEELQKMQIPLSYNQNGAFLRNQHKNHPIDWFVYTSALPDDHAELVLAKDLGIRTAKRDELLAYIIEKRNLKLLAIAGTHGKTSATSMAVWTLQQLGVPVSYSIGSTLSWGPSGKYDPTSEYFVYECDEFDRNMLHFSPHASIITSLDYDHPDTYPTKEDYLRAFADFLAQSKQSIFWHHDATMLPAIPDTAWCLKDDEVMPLKLAGIHNRQNATLVAKLLEYLVIGDSDARTKALESFPGANRRFEKLAPNLYSDYGHHPTEIAATLQAAREIANDIVLVYQPHQNVRQHEIQDQYVNCMEGASVIYWLPTYLSREDETLEVLSPEALTKNLVNKNAVTICDLNDELWSHIQIELHKGHLVLCMGAGSIDSWLRTKLAA